MITYKHDKGRHILSFNPEDIQIFAQIIWHLKNDPPAIGFNRRPMTAKQRAKIEEIYDHMGYPDNYAEILNNNGK